MQALAIISHREYCKSNLLKSVKLLQTLDIIVAVETFDQDYTLEDITDECTGDKM